MSKKPRPKPAKAHIGYRDFFNVRDASKGPLVLSDCTSVEWPKGWTPEHAATWREARNLLPPKKPASA